VNLRAVVALAAPLFLNSGIQAVLNLTDTWFLGHISTDAIAAVGAVYWFVIVFVLLFGGVAMAVQTLVAQAYGAGNRVRAARVTWSGLWAVLLVSPLFVIVSLSGSHLIAPFKLAPNIETLALEFWFPRLLGAIGGVALWTVSSFFNGIGRTKVTLLIMVCVAVVNALLNDLFIFHLGMGRTFQVTNLFPRLSVWENVRCATLWATGYRYSFWRSVDRLADARERTEKILTEINLLDRWRTPAGVLTYAEQRSLEIGRRAPERYCAILRRSTRGRPAAPSPQAAGDDVADLPRLPLGGIGAGCCQPLYCDFRFEVETEPIRPHSP